MGQLCTILYRRLFEMRHDTDRQRMANGGFQVTKYLHVIGFHGC